MADESAKGVQVGDVQQGGQDVQRRLGELEEVIDRIDRARRGGTVIRICVMLLLLAAVLVAGARILGIYNQVQKNQAQYQQAFREVAEPMFRDWLFAARDAAVEAAPHFRKAVENDLHKNREAILALLAKERDAFIEDAKQGIHDGLRQELDSLIRAQEAELMETFPRLKDPKAHDTVVKNMEAALGDVALKLMQGRFEAVVGRLGEVHDQAVKLLPADEQPRMMESTGRLFRQVQQLSKPEGK